MQQTTLPSFEVEVANAIFSCFTQGETFIILIYSLMVIKVLGGKNLTALSGTFFLKCTK